MLTSCQLFKLLCQLFKKFYIRHTKLENLSEYKEERFEIDKRGQGTNMMMLVQLNTSLTTLSILVFKAWY